MNLSNGNTLNIKYPIDLKNANGDIVYHENSDCSWVKQEYDNGNQKHYEDSNGYWSKSEFDADGNQTHYKNSDGYWFNREYDADGNQTYHENSSGRKTGTKRSEVVEMTMADIEKLAGHPVKVVK